VFDFAAPLPAIGSARAASATHQWRALGQADGRAWPWWSTRCLCTPRSCMKLDSKALRCFVILWWFTSKPRFRWHLGLFLVCYGAFRFCRVRARARRQPRLPAVRLGDDGQVLSLPMIVAACDAGVRIPAAPAVRQLPHGLTTMRNTTHCCSTSSIMAPKRATAPARHTLGVRLADAVRPERRLPVAHDEKLHLKSSCTSCSGS